MPKKSPMSEFDRALCKRIFFSFPGLTDGAIGKMLGLRRQSIQGWKSGKSRPTLTQIEQITRYTEIDWNWYTTGKTTSIKSVINAYFPKFYNSELIQNQDLYLLCRDIAERLIITGNSKLFLHPMKILYAAALTRLSSPINTHKQEIFTQDFMLSCSTIAVPEDVDKKIEMLYKEMNAAYCSTIPPKYPNYSNDSCETVPNAGESKTPILRAYSNINDIVFSKAEFAIKNVVRTNSVINIVGSAMSPIISDRQKVITGEGLTDTKIPKLANKLSIITLKIADQKEPTAIICKKASSITSDSLLLTSQDDNVEPLVFPMTQIVAIHPVKAILFNTQGN